MDNASYKEMMENLNKRNDTLRDRSVYLFGHCEASLTLADELINLGIHPIAILDNSKVKQGKNYKNIPVVEPTEVLKYDYDITTVLIVTRFYEAMNRQLRNLGFKGDIVKLVDYNSYAEYSFSAETRNRKADRVKHGAAIIDGLKAKYPDKLLVFCPFNALGDIYFTMEYLPAFLQKRGFGEYVVCVPSNSCASVARLFGAENIEVFEQKELDAAIQAIIYTKDKQCFIAHQDRPYVVNLHKILQLKKIPLEKVYCCGIFGLCEDTEPVKPVNWESYDDIEFIEEGKAVILSPYAKSVTALSQHIWIDIVADYKSKGYQVFTNISGDEKPIDGTEPLNVRLSEMKSVLEKAGTFIGVRSGLCDVVKTVGCRKIALYPDYNYCDTKWKAIDMYAIEGFQNIVVEDGDTWEEVKKQIKM